MVSIVICTYNRAHLLEKCLHALVPQMIEKVSVIVVDNKSTDDTKEVVEQYKDKISKLHYVYEGTQGLSYARNRGYLESNAEWIAYLDDDGIPRANYVDRLFYTIENYDFDCFGGMYYAYYDTEKPKWIPDSFGTKRLIIEETGRIEKNTLSGGIFNVKREVLESLGGFDTNYGMSGNKMAYSEESELQYRIRAAGYNIGFDPLLQMDHIVARYKFPVYWHLKRIYTEFRDSPIIKVRKASYKLLLKEFLKSTIRELPMLVRKVIREDDYYFQNLLIDYLRPTLTVYGALNNPLRKKQK